MREIVFRGKSIKENKWVYGYYWVNKENHFIKEVIYESGYFKDNLYIKEEILNDIEIKKDTVGQFTGLRDKNGVEIYENMEIDNKYIVLYEECKYILKDISNNDIIDLWRYINENGGEITKEYTKI